MGVKVQYAKDRFVKFFIKPVIVEGNIRDFSIENDGVNTLIRASNIVIRMAKVPTS